MLYKKLAIAIVTAVSIGVAGCDYSVSGPKRPVLAQSGQDATIEPSTPSEDSGSENINTPDSGNTTIADSGGTGVDGGQGTVSDGGTTAGSQGTTGGTGTTGSGTTGSGTDSVEGNLPGMPITCRSIPDCTGDTVCVNHQCIAIQCSQQSDCDPYYNGALNCWSGYCHGCSNAFWDQNTMHPGFFKCSEGYCLGTGTIRGVFDCNDPIVKK